MGPSQDNLQSGVVVGTTSAAVPHEESMRHKNLPPAPIDCLQNDPCPLGSTSATTAVSADNEPPLKIVQAAQMSIDTLSDDVSEYVEQV